MNERLIKTLANEQMHAGTHQLVWNAKDANVVAGNYLLKMQAENYYQTKRLAVMK